MDRKRNVYVKQEPRRAGELVSQQQQLLQGRAGDPEAVSETDGDEAAARVRTTGDPATVRFSVLGERNRSREPVRPSYGSAKRFESSSSSSLGAVDGRFRWWFGWNDADGGAGQLRPRARARTDMDVTRP